VFGHVKEGKNLVNQIATYGTHEGKVLKKIIISDCGIITGNKEVVAFNPIP